MANFNSMPRRPSKGIVPLALTIFWLCSTVRAQSPDTVEYFEKQIRPLLSQHCFECHSHKSRRLEANLYLDSRAGLLQGGDSGPAIVPGSPDGSPLIQAVRYEGYEMPPRGKMPPADIDKLVRWVAAGAVWPKEDSPAPPVAAQAFDWQLRQQTHWAWQPVKAVEPPRISDPAWSDSPVDRFILQKLQSQQLQPAAPADSRTWLRRVYFDLIGLPPPVDLVASFPKQDSPEVRRQLVDDLLQSPRFGEKWARHWMDLVRYAETHGHEFDYPIPHAWQYRDYLIRAFNTDVPYDQLLREHIAGDLLEHPRYHPETGRNESVIGTGFWYLGEAVHAPTNVLADLSTRVENQIDVFGRAFLGLSIACARCHDHKFDAISKEDYYALYGILNSTHRTESWLDAHHDIENQATALQARQTSTLQQTHTWLAAEPALADDTISRSLQAACVVLGRHPDSSPPALEQLLPIAQSFGLDPQRLLQWVQALRDPQIASLQHPAVLWSRIGTVAPQAVDARCSALHDELLQARQRAEQDRKETVSLGDFNSNQFEGWQPQGIAFGTGPVTGLAWNMSPGSDVFQLPGIVCSGGTSPRLRGALRSPVFTLTHPVIHTRLRARHAMLRVVIENYYMDQYQPLLFGQATRKDIDTAGKFIWITQQGDLKNHLGRRAYLEVLDPDNGEVAIDEIVMSSGNAPSDAPSAAALELTAPSRPMTVESLAQACQQQWIQRIQTALRGPADSDSIALINWMTTHRLLDASEQIRRLRETLLKQAETIPEPMPVLSTVDGVPVEEQVHIRGSDENFGETVPQRFLLAISGTGQAPITSGSGRLELADRVTQHDNPFLSRVIVNRIWHHLFGRGIVASVDDFGVMGQLPTHPELLDWLAQDFLEHQLSLKHTIRTLVLSKTYAQSSSHHHAQAEMQDPANLLWHRMAVRKLSAEQLRDAILQISGRLDLQMSGKSVPAYLTSFMQGRGRPATNGPLDGAGRRTVYLEVRRNFLSPFLLTFDMPIPFSCMGHRATSNVPAQALILMNDPFILEQSRLWAHQALDTQHETNSRIDHLFRQAYARPARPEELELIETFLHDRPGVTSDTDELQTWADVCHMLLNRKEFVFLQ